MIKKIFELIAEYFAFFAGFLFVFVLGLVYAIFRPEGLVFNLVFIVVITGFVIYLVKSFWELLEKGKKEEEIVDDADIKIIESSEDSKIKEE
jgi:hypothetical protein